MTTFNLYPADLDKWMYQNSAHYTGEFIDGCLLDNFIVETKRGYAVFYEEYLNCWQSWYRVEFSADTKEIDHMFAEFIEIRERMYPEVV